MAVLLSAAQRQLLTGLDKSREKPIAVVCLSVAVQAICSLAGPWQASQATLISDH